MKVAAIIGVGPGLGTAVARKFASQGFSVGLISRNLEKLSKIQKDIEASFNTVKVSSAAADCAKEDDLKSAIKKIRSDLGHPNVLVYNTGANFKRASILDLNASDLTSSFNTQVVGALVAVKEVLPDMIAKNSGTIIFTGATAQTRGGAQFAAFATAKFALRALAQSLAREVQPKGVHVALVNIDGMIKDSPSHQANSSLPDEKFLFPEHVAETYYQLYAQHKSAWTHEIDLRPFLENW